MTPTPLIRITFICTLPLMAWSVVEIINHGITLWRGAVLAYLLLVVITLWVTRGDLDEKLPSTDPTPGNQFKGKTPEEIIFEIIRSKNRARRHDFMPHLKMSKTTLVRLLDIMEEKGLIEQVGDRKSSFYRIKG